VAWDFSIKGREINLAVTETFKYTYHFDNGDGDLDHDRFHQFLNVLDVSLSHDVFRIGTRLDLNLFADDPFGRECPTATAVWWCGEADSRYRQHIAAERLYFIVARREFDLTLGDFYVSLGKGIALNIVKLDELGQDTTIRGGKFLLHYRDFEVTFLGGEINPLDVDEATGRLTIWPAEPLIAGRVEYRFFDKVIAGAHSVYVFRNSLRNSAGTSSERTDYNLIGGVTVEAPNIRDGLLSFAGEVDLQRTVYLSETIRGPGAEDGAAGIAAYGSTTLHLGKVTLLGEFKYYDGLQLKAENVVNEPYTLFYNQPPTLERVNAEVTDNTSVTGGRLRADYNFGELGTVELLAFVNYAYFYNWAKGDHRIHDPYVGVELQWQEGQGHLHVSGGVRREDNRDKGQVYRQDVHVEFDVEQRLSKSHSLKINGQYLRRQRQLLSLDEWSEADVTLNYKWSPRLAVGLTYERQEDPSIISARLQTATHDEPALGACNYLSGAAQYYFTPSTYVAVRVGSARAGLKCINGVCRLYPGFAGAQLSVVARF
jgi:hypothetical protein